VHLIPNAAHAACDDSNPASTPYLCRKAVNIRKELRWASAATCFVRLIVLPLIMDARVKPAHDVEGVAHSLSTVIAGFDTASRIYPTCSA
jgi:hypothetical protein